MSAHKGFTLIELLVVITIIAILATIGLYAYNLVQKSARDAKRQSDLKLIQSALEQYHADQKYYPVSLGTSITFTLPDSKRTYLNSVPTDPSPGSAYSYTPLLLGCDNSSSNFCNKYCLYATVENPSNVVDLSNGNCPAGANRYMLTSP